MPSPRNKSKDAANVDQTAMDMHPRGVPQHAPDGTSDANVPRVEDDGRWRLSVGRRPGPQRSR